MTSAAVSVAARPFAPIDIERQIEGVTAFLIREAAPYGFVSLLLTGSLGRGEGCALMTERGPRPFNDVDLALVTERRLPHDVVAAWASEATALLDPDSRYRSGGLSPLGLHVDLAAFQRPGLGRLPKTLFAFDLRSSRVLAGEDVIEELPAFYASALPAREALFLLGNRCLSLCESADFPEAGTAIWMHYHALKAVIDSGAALLILSGRYATDFETRIERLREVVPREFEALAGRWPHVPDLIAEAVESRRALDPNISWADALVTWREARALILETLRCAVSRVTGLPEYTRWPELSAATCRWWTSFDGVRNGRSPLSGATRWLALRTAGLPRRLRAQAAVYAAAPLLLAAIEPGSESPAEAQKDLQLARSYLTRLRPETRRTKPALGWRGLRDSLVDAWKRAI